MQIDTKIIQADLDALVNPVFTDTDGQVIPRHNTMKVVVKVDRQMTSTVGLDETDHSYTIRLNRIKIRDQAQLDEKVAWVKKEIGGI
ncbi:hypothetical protein LCGC14_0970720 [marine sediment metagenome]|uniref:Uncharacterized protein n=1 Tax=marine sediment metagenome TaxID=412755 RepID=A0A0F9NBU4_9ZZZZ